MQYFRKFSFFSDIRKEYESGQVHITFTTTKKKKKKKKPKNAWYIEKNSRIHWGYGLTHSAVRVNQ